jgi:hypothetical protein
VVDVDVSIGGHDEHVAESERLRRGQDLGEIVEQGGVEVARVPVATGVARRRHVWRARAPHLEHPVDRRAAQTARTMSRVDGASHESTTAGVGQSRSSVQSTSPLAEPICREAVRSA